MSLTMIPLEDVTKTTLYDIEKVSEQNHCILPERYRLRGYLITLPTIGESVWVWRTHRQDDTGEIIECTGIFNTSPVQEILENGDAITVRTMNSHWRFTKL